MLTKNLTVRMNATMNDPKQIEPNEVVEARFTACHTGLDGIA
jgi:hypothetical protein